MGQQQYYVIVMDVLKWCSIPTYMYRTATIQKAPNQIQKGHAPGAALLLNPWTQSAPAYFSALSTVAKTWVTPPGVCLMLIFCIMMD